MKAFFNIRLSERIFLIAGLLLLAACSTLTRDIQDGPPARPVDVSSIPDGEPAPVVRTRAGNAPRYTINGRTYTTLKDSKGYRARGIASWYGTKFHGRPTANGEPYDMFSMTAAHKTLPIPSYVRVTHVGNGRSIVVRINDRGPFHDNRLIDLSYAAARKLGVDATGTALVDVVDVTPDSSSIIANVDETEGQALTDASGNRWFIQLGAFQQAQKAQLLQQRASGVLEEKVNVVEGVDSIHRVVVGPIADQQRIPQVQRSLKQSGLDAGFVTRKRVAR